MGRRNGGHTSAFITASFYPALSKSTLLHGCNQESLVIHIEGSTNAHKVFKSVAHDDFKEPVAILLSKFQAINSLCTILNAQMSDD